MENSSSANVPAYFLAEYSLDGGNTWESLVSNQEVGVNGSEFASVAVPDGQQIRWRYKTSTTSNSFTGSYSYWGPDFLVDCGNPSVSASLGSCANGSATSTFLMLNLPTTSTTVYFEVEYKVTDADGNDLAWTAHPSGSSVSVADSASSSLTHSINVGEKITWRYRTSSQDGTFSGSYTETSQSDAVTCAINPGASQALASSCSGSSKDSTLTLTNASPTATTTAYYNVQYKIDDGSYQTHTGGASVSVSIDGTATLTQAVPNGSTITWQYRTSQNDGSFSGSYTAIATSDTVVCATPAASATQEGSCSAGADNITIDLDNRNQLVAHHFKVEYSTDGGTTWTTGDNDLSDKTVSADTLEQVTLKTSDFAHGTTVSIRYYTFT